MVCKICVADAVKWIHEPIDVQTRGGWPIRYSRGHATVRVRDVIKLWVLQTQWWSNEERREYFRLETTAGVVDIYYRIDDIHYEEGTICYADGTWVLARVSD